MRTDEREASTLNLASDSLDLELHIEGIYTSTVIEVNLFHHYALCPYFVDSLIIEFIIFFAVDN